MGENEKGRDMSKELIERLRADAESTDDIGLCAEAADRIEELEREDAAWRKLNEQADKTVDRAEQERDALQADNARLREALCYALQAWKYDGICDEHGSVFAEADSICNSTPAQSLARIRNQVRDECATAGGPEDSYQDEWFKAKVDSAARILATKEPE